MGRAKGTGATLLPSQQGMDREAKDPLPAVPPQSTGPSGMHPFHSRLPETRVRDGSLSPGSWAADELQTGVLGAEKAGERGGFQSHGVIADKICKGHVPRAGWGRGMGRIGQMEIRERGCLRAKRSHQLLAGNLPLPGDLRADLVQGGIRKQGSYKRSEEGPCRRTLKVMRTFPRPKATGDSHPCPTLTPTPPSREGTGLSGEKQTPRTGR